MTGRVAQVVEFKPQYCKKGKEKRRGYSYNPIPCIGQGS
jgi:hypothetical protein